MVYGEEEGEVFLGRSVTQHKSLSDETTHLIDEEVRAIIDRNYDRAATILRENIDILHSMAEALIKYETIDSNQIDQLMSRETVSPPKDWDDTGEKGSGEGAQAEPSKGEPKPGAGTVGGPAGQH